MKRALRLPFVIGAVLLFGIVGVVLFKVAADGKPPGILLKWDPPAAVPGATVSGYNVFRVEPDGTYQRIAAGLKVTTYVDHDVSSGTTYHYFVKAVNPDGYQGPPSNVAPVAIP